jgi:class 3 adenylate cyclase/tetratricopeptide (TPR) repeat protein
VLDGWESTDVPEPAEKPSMTARGANGLSVWLREAGLSHLESILSEQGIDVDVIPDVTAEDLAAIGVRLGDRVRFRKAQQAMQSLSQVEAATASLPPEGSPSDQQAAAERRYLTVMFCDLAGSTRMTASLDPEETRRILRDYRTAVGAEVKRLDGHVAQYLGDGILAYFGWPRALEDAPRRAAAAALSVVRAVAAIPAPEGLPVAARVGIATGMVVVGDFLSDTESEERTAVGDVVNIAARLQDMARPGSVVVASSTHRHLGDSFDTTALGSATLKGISTPVDMFEITGQREASAATAGDPDGKGRAHLIGRDEEMMLVRRRWRQALDGDGQVVLVTGDPGIGKSRLTAAIIHELAAENPLRLRFFCSPFHLSTALYPVIQHITVAAGIKPGDAAETRLDKLEAFIAASGADVAATVPHLARMMSIPAEHRYDMPELTPMVRKARTFQALSGIIEAGARRRPTLIILEDAHWLDPTSLELFELLIQSIATLPVLLVVNARPEFRETWAHAGNLTTLSLQRLPRPLVTAIAESVCGGRALPQRLIDIIAERADGVPLFVEELTRTILDSGLLSDQGDHYVMTAPFADFAIPNTLRDSLAARLDRHPKTREVAQTAACIGREFEFWLLCAVMDRPAAEIEAALDTLQKAEIISRRGIPPEAVYTFRHVLVRDAAADSLLKSRLRQIHERIARTIETQVPDFAAARPELLAHHFTQAQCIAEACTYRQKAGNLALAASGNTEAIREFNVALELIGLMPPGPERDKQELDILVALAIPLTLTLGYAAPDVEAAYWRAMKVCERLDDDAQSFPIVYGFWRFYLLRADYANARALSASLVAMAERTADESAMVTANRAAGSSGFYTARFAEALSHLERTAGIHPSPDLRQSVLSYDVVDPWVVNHAYSGMALWICGRSAEARRENDLAIELARRINHPFTLSLSLCFATWTYQFEGDREKVRELAEEALTLSRSHNFTFWAGWAEVMLAWALHREDAAATRDRMRQGLQLWQSTGSLLGLSYFQSLLAEVSEGAEAALLLDNAERFAGEHDENFWLPEIHRLRGCFILQEDYADAAELAEASFRDALDTARKLGARALELRAARSLSELWARQGRDAEAESLLAGIATGLSPHPGGGQPALNA